MLYMLEQEQPTEDKPWKNKMTAPNEQPQLGSVNNSKPEVDMQIDYVYGYSCFDSRNNLYYTANQN